MNTLPQVFVSFCALTNVAARRARVANDVGEVRQMSQRLALGVKIWEDWATRWGGSLVSNLGEEGSIQLSAAALDELDSIRTQFADKVGYPASVGVGTTLHDADRAMKVAVKRGGNTSVVWSDELMEELANDEDDLTKGGFEGKMTAARPLSPSPEGSEHSQGEAIARMVDEQAPGAPEKTHTADEIAEMFHQLARQRQAENPEQAPQADEETQKLKQGVAQALMAVKEQMPVLEQVKQQAPQVYAAVVGLANAVSIMARKLLGGQEQPMQKSETLRKTPSSFDPPDFWARKVVSYHPGDGQDQLTLRDTHQMPDGNYIRLHTEPSEDPSVEAHRYSIANPQGKQLAVVGGYVAPKKGFVLSSMAVDQGHRGRGYGRALLSHIANRHKRIETVGTVSSGLTATMKRLGEDGQFSVKLGLDGVKHDPHVITVKRKPKLIKSNDTLFVDCDKHGHTWGEDGVGPYCVMCGGDMGILGEETGVDEGEREKELKKATFYHGTPKRFVGPFSIGEKAGTNSAEVWGETVVEPVIRHAAFFTRSKKMADNFVERGGAPDEERSTGQGGVIPVKLNHGKTLDLRDMHLGHDWGSSLGDTMQTHRLVGGDHPQWQKKAWKLFDGEYGKRFTSALKDAGYGSVIFREEGPDGRDVQTHAILNPDQITRLDEPTEVVPAKEELDKATIRVNAVSGAHQRHNVLLPVASTHPTGPNARKGVAGRTKVLDQDSGTEKWRQVRSGMVMSPDGTPTSSKNPKGE